MPPYVDAERRFEIVVPRGWHAEPMQSPPDVAAVISDIDAFAPMVTVKVIEGFASAMPDEQGIAEFNAAMLASHEPGTLDLKTEVATIDGVPGLHMTMLKTEPAAAGM